MARKALSLGLPRLPDADWATRPIAQIKRDDETVPTELFRINYTATFMVPAAFFDLGSSPLSVLAVGFCRPIFTVCLPLLYTRG